MPSLKDLYLKLEQHHNFECEDNIEIFLETVDAIVLKNDPSCITTLAVFLDDNSDYDIINASLMSSIEYFENGDYVENILKIIPEVYQKAPECAEELMSRLFNYAKKDETLLSFLNKKIHLVAFDIMFKILALIDQESPHHKELCEELKQLVLEGPKET